MLVCDSIAPTAFIGVQWQSATRQGTLLAGWVGGT